MADMIQNHKEYKAFFWVVILVVVFYLKEELIGERERMNMKMWAFVTAAFLLGLSDLIGEFINRGKKTGSAERTLR